jgi:hypothetical protein
LLREILSQENVKKAKHDMPKGRIKPGTKIEMSGVRIEMQDSSPHVIQQIDLHYEKLYANMETLITTLDPSKKSRKSVNFEDDHYKSENYKTNFNKERIGNMAENLINLYRTHSDRND